MSSLARGAVEFLRMLRLNQSSYFHQNAVFCGDVDYPLNLAKREAFFSWKHFTKNEPLGSCWNMVPKSRIWIVFISPTGQQGGCRVKRRVQRHPADGFAGDPLQWHLGLWVLCGWDLICCWRGCGLSGPAYFMPRSSSGQLWESIGQWPIPFFPASIWQAKKGSMNILKSKPWCNTCLGCYEYLLYERGSGRVSAWKSSATALWHQGGCSEFSPPVRRMISAILNLRPEGGM